MDGPRRVEWITDGRGSSYVRALVDADWVAFLRIVPQEGRPVIAELRVVPAASAAEPPTEWLRTPPPPVPLDGLSRDHLKRLPLYAFLDDERQLLDWGSVVFGLTGQASIAVNASGVLSDSVGASTGDVTVALTGVEAVGTVSSLAVKPRPGRPREVDAKDYAEIARDYHAACQSSKTPIKVVAKKMGLAEHIVRNRVAKARQAPYEFLAKAKAGRKGGGLTEHGRAAVLALLQKTTSRRRRPR